MNLLNNHLPYHCFKEVVQNIKTARNTLKPCTRITKARTRLHVPLYHFKGSFKKVIKHDKIYSSRLLTPCLNQRVSLHTSSSNQDCVSQQVRMITERKIFFGRNMQLLFLLLLHDEMCNRNE